MASNSHPNSQSLSNCLSCAAITNTLGLNKLRKPAAVGSESRSGARGGQHANETGPWPSRAIVQGAINALQAVRKKAEAGTLRPEDARAATVTTRIYFNHLEEIGFNAVMDAKFKDEAFRKQVLDFVPNDEEIKSLAEKFQKEGVAISQDRLRALYGLSRSRRTVLLDEIANQGIANVQASVLRGLERLEVRLSNAGAARPDSAGARNPAISLASGTTPSPLPDVDLCGWLELQGIGFAVGCVFGCIPCCGAAIASEIQGWLCEHGLLIFW